MTKRPYATGKPPPTAQLRVADQEKTQTLPPSSPPPRKSRRMDMAEVVASINRRTTFDQTTINATAISLYNTEESFPLLSFLQAWKDERFNTEPWFVLAVTKAYLALCARHGARPGE